MKRALVNHCYDKVLTYNVGHTGVIDIASASFRGCGGPLPPT